MVKYRACHRYLICYIPPRDELSPVWHPCYVGYHPLSITPEIVCAELCGYPVNDLDRFQDGLLH